MFSVSNNYAEYESQTDYEVKFPNVARQELEVRNARILEIAKEKKYKILDSDCDDDNQYFYDMEAKMVYEVLSLDEYDKDDVDEHHSNCVPVNTYKAQITNPTFTPMEDKKEMNHLLALNAII